MDMILASGYFVEKVFLLWGTRVGLPARDLVPHAMKA